MADEIIEEEVVVAPAITPDPAPAQYDRFGGVLQTRPDAIEGSELGRAKDLSFLGAAAQNPVGAAQDAGRELIRDGTLGGVSLDDVRGAQSLMSDFPMAPGTSSAAMGSYEINPETGEPAIDPQTGRKIPILNAAGDDLALPSLPEMFTGKNVMNPHYEEMQQRLDNPDLTFMERVGLMGALRDMEGSETQRAPSGMGAGMSNKDKALISAAALTMFDPAEVSQMLMQVDEETGERKWPQFQMQHAPDGTVIMNNTINGARAMINAPGMSAMDAVQALGVGIMFTPSGRMTGAMTGTAGRIAVGATTAGLTEAAIQTGQEAAGGQFDKGDVAISTAAGPLIELARPLMGGVQRTGRFIGSYIPEDWGARLGKSTGLDQAIPAAKAQMLTFAKNAKEYLQSGRNAIVTTQDAVPEAHTPFRQILLKMVERMPLTGTGGLRKAQQQQRVEVLANLADRYNLNPNTNYGARVLDNINQAGGARLNAARASVDDGIEAMAGNDVVLRDFRLTIRDIIADEEKYGDLANKGLIDLLNKVRTTVWVGGKPTPGKLPRDFGSLNDWVERLYMEAGRAPKAAREPLEQAAASLQRDLARHAADDGGEAGARWLQGTREIETLVNGSERRTLRGLIEAGEVDDQVIRRVLKSADPAQLNLLRDNLTRGGRRQAQQMILRNAMRVGGWRRSEAIEAVVDPKKVLNWLESEPVEAQLRTFFPGKTAQQELGGMMEYLRMTAAAGETGKGVGMAASGGIGQIGASAVNLVTLGLAGLAGHAYQSAPARNLLLRLYHVKSDPRMKDAIMQELTGVLMGLGRQQGQEWAADDPQDSVYVSDEWAEAQEDGGQGGVMEQTMQQLREATGAAEEDEDGPGITDRLMQMLGMGGDEEVVEETVE